MFRDSMALSALVLSLNAIAGGPKTPPPPLREPSVTVFVTKRGTMDSDACRFYHPELWSTSDASTRDSVMMEIVADTRLDAIVKSAKTAAKDTAVKTVVKKIESKRPDRSGKIVFTLSKNEDNGGGVSYGMRIGLIFAGDTSRSLPVWQVKCEGVNPNGGYTYRQAGYAFEGSHLNWTRLDGNASGDVFKGLYEVVPEAEMGDSAKILEHLQKIESRIPTNDTDLSFSGRFGGDQT